jgi:16S rRNA (uracil1498-N3)-methyltransferase
MVKLLFLKASSAMHLFYTPDIAGATHELNEEESRHAIRVLRLRSGDLVVAVDGKGGWFEAVLTRADPKRCLLEIRSASREYQPLPYCLHLGVSPTKSMDRFEWFLEKATEIGISEITPLICHRTERYQLKYERLERILVSAMKQSLRAYKPVLHEAMDLKSFVRSRRDGVLGIAHCLMEQRTPVTELPSGSSYTILVGPEGDFTEEEVELTRKTGYLPVHLGEARLRTETAAIYLVSALRLRHLE